MYKSNISTTFCLSKDLKLPFKLKIGSLQLNTASPAIETLFICIQLISSNRPLTTPLTLFINNNTNNNDSRWIEFPIHYSLLPLDTKLSLSLYTYNSMGHKTFVGESHLNLFNIDAKSDESDNYTLKKGFQRVEIITSSSSIGVDNDTDNLTLIDQENIMENLKKKIKLHENGDILTIDWLDHLTFRRIEQINKSTTPVKSNYLQLELAQFDVPIVFSDVKYSIINIPKYSDLNNANDVLASVSIMESSTALSESYRPIFDPDQYRDFNDDDPIDMKFRKLERIHQSSILDKDIKPTLKVRSKIFEVLTKQFFEKLNSQEKNLIWKFRFYLLNNFLSNKSLQFNNFVINFIKCINWDEEFEVNEFLNIINEVQNQHNKENLFIQELEIVDCLELLSYNYRNPIIRKLAIERLKMAKDEELELYFLQLVQALKYESDTGDPSEDEDMNNSTITNTSNNDFTFIDSTELSDHSLLTTGIATLPLNNNSKLIRLKSPLLNFLIERAVENKRLTSFFYWYVKVEIDGERKRQTQSRQPQHDNTEVDDGNVLVDNHESERQKNHSCKFIKDDKIFSKTMNNFIVTLLKSPNGPDKLGVLSRQIEVFSRVRETANNIKNVYRKEPTSKKVEVLRKVLSEKENKKKKRHNSSASASSLSSGDNNHDGSVTLSRFDPIPLPLDPDIEICGTIPQESSVFKSSLAPLKITFVTTDNGKYPLMYKIGDDLRQDQFVIQIMTLIEKILKNENLDLKLKPYKILALGELEGLIEFIPNEALSSILSNNQGSILNFLQKHNPDPNARLNVQPEVMDNYIRSCAGYCVVTYLLGVGDRHLDNLLLTKDGYFFHVDFGYILGEDPKPFPPLMKLPAQIIEGMGGLMDENYKLFCNYCFITYITLRKNSNLILNLFQLMIDSTIPVLQTINGDELEKFELILKVKEKFMLELSEEEAILHFQNLINDSVNAFLPVVIDRLHSFAQYWRA